MSMEKRPTHDLKLLILEWYFLYWIYSSNGASRGVWGIRNPLLKPEKRRVCGKSLYTYIKVIRKVHNDFPNTLYKKNF